MYLLYLHITSIKSDEVNLLLDTVGGLTGLKTLEYNNKDNEILKCYIEKIINIVSIVSKNNIKSEVIIYIK